MGVVDTIGLLGTHLPQIGLRPTWPLSWQYMGCAHHSPRTVFQFSPHVQHSAAKLGQQCIKSKGNAKQFLTMGPCDVVNQDEEIGLASNGSKIEALITTQKKPHGLIGEVRILTDNRRKPDNRIRVDKVIRADPINCIDADTNVVTLLLEAERRNIAVGYNRVLEADSTRRNQ